MANAKANQVLAKPHFAELSAVETAIERLCEIAAKISKREAQLSADCARLRTYADNELAGIKQEQAQLESDVEAYCRFHRDEHFTETKTLKFTHGEVSFRLGKLTLTYKGRLKDEDIVAKIREMFTDADDYIRVEEKPNKLALAELTKEALAQVGIIPKQEEKFEIKVKTEAVTPAKAAA